MMTNIPILKIELEGIKENVAHYMGQHTDEINSLVIETLNKTLDEKWVKTEIQKSVNESLQRAIKNLAHDHLLSCAIKEVVLMSLTDIIERNKNGNEK